MNNLKITQKLRKIYRQQTLFVLSLLFIFSLNLAPIMAQTTSNKITDKNPHQLVIEGQKYYQQQKYKEAAELLQQAVKNYQQQGDNINAAMASSNLSLVYQQQGKWQEAKNTIEQSLNLLEKQPKTPESLKVEAQSLDIQGHIAKETGEPAAAFKIWQKAEQIYNQNANHRGLMQNKINQTQVLQDLGMYPRSCDMLLNLLGIDLAKFGQQLNINLRSCISLSGLNLTQSEKFTKLVINNIPQDMENPLKFKLLNNLANVLLQIVGIATIDNSYKNNTVEQLLKEAEKYSSNSQERAIVYMSLGNVAKTHVDTQLSLVKKEHLNFSKDDPYSLSNKINESLCYYEKALAQSSSITLKIQSQINQLHIVLIKNQIFPEQKIITEAQKIWHNFQTEISSLPVNKTLIFAKIKIAQIILEYPEHIKNNSFNQEEIRRLLLSTNTQAKQLENKQAEAYTLSYLGKLYEINEQWTEAEKSTKEAIKIAPIYANSLENRQGDYLNYQLSSQLGDIFFHKYNQSSSEKDLEKAVNSYTQAFNILKSIRQDLVGLNPDIQVFFNNKIEPFYRKLADLDLTLANFMPNGEKKQQQLDQSRQVIEALQLEELNNFFRIICLNPNPEQIDKIDGKTVIIYPIILPDRLEVIFSYRNHNQIVFSRHTEKIKKEVVEETIKQLTNNLATTDNRDEFDKDKEAKTIYQWLLKDFETTELKTWKQQLNNQNINLVFVLDGVLRSVPMAVLYDGNKYLIEKYAIATTPSLQLLSSNKITELKLNALTGGVSKSYHELPELKNTEDELKEIQRLGISGEPLLNDDFTKKNLSDRIKESSFNILHLSTHAKYDSQPEETYFITADSQINILELKTILEDRNNANPIELLVLSACETAKSQAENKRSPLGLAGVALRSGARSTLASLWAVDQEST
ncbi:MAG TPA: CHAT domain-containing protein, partial [Allocoleopsis sp.]